MIKMQLNKQKIYLWLKYVHLIITELEPVRQSGSGPAEPDGFYRIFFDFFARFFVRFLPDFCQFDVKNEPDGF